MGQGGRGGGGGGGGGCSGVLAMLEDPSPGFISKLNAYHQQYVARQRLFPAKIEYQITNSYIYD